jgi:hypothetical protein
VIFDFGEPVVPSFALTVMVIVFAVTVAVPELNVSIVPEPPASVTAAVTLAAVLN